MALVPWVPGDCILLVLTCFSKGWRHKLVVVLLERVRHVLVAGDYSFLGVLHSAQADSGVIAKYLSVSLAGFLVQ
jgi:hypothetical protein